MSKKSHRGRKDHYIPQGYLRGFIDPARSSLNKPLWHFCKESNEWSEKSPAEVGWERGFYDRATTTTQQEQEHPDVTFSTFEYRFPMVRDHMLRKNFKDWVKQHRAFLLGYMQMMRARSPLFIRQKTEQNQNLRGANITSVGPGNQITVDSLELRPFPRDVVRNAVIGQMQQEIKKGPDWMWEFNWCLRYTKSVSDPFVTGTQPLVVEGPAPTIDEAIKHPETLIFFPLCWEACLIGSLCRFHEGTAEATSSDISRIRNLFFKASGEYVIAPRQVDWTRGTAQL